MVSFAGYDVQSNRAGIVILEVRKRSAVAGRHRECRHLACRTSEARDRISVSRCDSGDSIVLLDGRDSVKRGRQRHGSAKHCEVNATRTGEREAGCLELRLQREAENELACHARVGRRNIEVEGRGDLLVDSAEVHGSVRGCWLGRVDGDNEMRELEVCS
jgi:hypothetical protein